MTALKVRSLRGAAYGVCDIFGTTHSCETPSGLSHGPTMQRIYHSMRFQILKEVFSRRAANAVFSIMENSEQLFTPSQTMSNSIFLRLSRKGLGLYKQPINIDHTPYQIFDPSSRNKWFYCLQDVDVIIFVASLSGYYRREDGDVMMVKGILASILDNY